MVEEGREDSLESRAEHTDENVSEEEKMTVKQESVQSVIDGYDEEGRNRAKKKPDGDNLFGATSLKHCDVCSQPFRYVSSLVAHKKSQHPEKKKFECPVCKEELASWLLYEKHLNKHERPEEELKTVKCDVCSKDFEYINSLIQHRRVTHPDNKTFECTLCGTVSNIYKDYKLHLRVDHKDSGIKLSLSCLVCDICGKKFLCHYNLSNHRKYHSSPQFRCGVCEKMLKSKKSLKCHQRIHTGEKPYTCEKCGKCFPGKSYLINHSFMHTGQKPFVCETCGKAFAKKWNLIQHERIHTGERPYKCPVCCKSFIQNFILKVHMRKVHDKDLSELGKGIKEEGS